MALLDNQRLNDKHMSEEQRLHIVELLVAGYTVSFIKESFERKGWKAPSHVTIQNYRIKFQVDIENARAERYKELMENGLALQDERVARLTQHAEKLESLGTDAQDEKGTLIVSKEYRETIADIAAEVGGRQKKLDITTGGKPLVMEDVIHCLDKQ